MAKTKSKKARKTGGASIKTIEGTAEEIQAIESGGIMITETNETLADKQQAAEALSTTVTMGVDPGSPEGDKSVTVEVQLQDGQIERPEVREVMVKCPKCGDALVNIVSGSVCARGCGGLHPKVPADAQAIAVRQIRTKSLPRATLLTHLRARGEIKDGDVWCDHFLYSIAGHYGIYRRVKRPTQSVAKSEIHTTTGTVVQAYEEANNRVIACMEYTDAQSEAWRCLDDGTMDAVEWFDAQVLEVARLPTGDFVANAWLTRNEGETRTVKRAGPSFLETMVGLRKAVEEAALQETAENEKKEINGEG